MKTMTVLTLLMSISVFANQKIVEGERAGIPKREDAQKQMTPVQKTIPDEVKKEQKENQEDVDPVFYDSTTSPREMDEEDHVD